MNISRTSLIRSLSRECFRDFVQIFWNQVPGSQPLQWNWHMDVLCDELQYIAERVFKSLTKEHDLLINISPGTSKSTICSILFHAWTWTRMPSARHINASHTDTLVLDLATKSRSVVESELYQRCFPEIVLRRDQDTKGYYANTMGGDRVSCTVGGKSPMGFHAHFLSFDDPVDPQKVLSDVELENANRFAPDVLFTRKVNKQITVFFGVMQRLRHNDPSWALLNLEQYKSGGDRLRHICLPAELTDDVNPPELKEKYVEGLMDPIRLGEAALRPYKANPYTYAGQFLQNPQPLGGGMFKEEYFSRRVKTAPFDARRVLYVDRASTSEGGCFTAMVLMARDKDDNCYVENVIRGQWEPKERNDKILAEAQRCRGKYGPKYEPTIMVEAEGGSSGKDAWLGLAKMLAGYRVKQEHPTGSKDVRAEPWASALGAGYVYIVDNGESQGLGKSPWDIEAFVTEHKFFRPTPGKRLGKWKDQVDAAAAGYTYLFGKVKAGLPLRSISFDQKKIRFRVVLSTYDSLSQLHIDTRHKCLLVGFRDPLPEGMSLDFPALGFDCVDQAQFSFADLDPADYQGSWDEPVPPFDKTPDQLIMTQDQGRKFWSFVLRQRQSVYDVIVLCDEGDRRSLSAGIAVCECMNQPRTALYKQSNPEDDNKGEPPNSHVYEMVKRCRGFIAS